LPAFFENSAMSPGIHPGIYDALLDEALRDLLGRYPDLLHWESQSNTARASATCQNLINDQAGATRDQAASLIFNCFYCTLA
jgi:hypothetical protein